MLVTFNTLFMLLGLVIITKLLQMFEKSGRECSRMVKVWSNSNFVIYHLLDIG